jgi:hypothetical protein
LAGEIMQPRRRHTGEFINGDQHSSISYIQMNWPPMMLIRDCGCFVPSQRLNLHGDGCAAMPDSRTEQSLVIHVCQWMGRHR